MNECNDIVQTPYGAVRASALRDFRATYDIRSLLPCIEDLDQLREYLGADRGLRDSLTRLFCILSTLLCGSSLMVPPDDGGFASLLDDIRSDLHDGMALFQTCLELIAPIDQLQVASNQ